MTMYVVNNPSIGNSTWEQNKNEAAATAQPIS